MNEGAMEIEKERNSESHEGSKKDTKEGGQNERADAHTKGRKHARRTKERQEEESKQGRREERKKDRQIKGRKKGRNKEKKNERKTGRRK